MSEKTLEGWNQSFEQIQRHYQVEKELASRLRNSTREEREYLYTIVYDELCKRVPSNPTLRRKADSKANAERISRQIQFVDSYLKPETVFLEVGPGDCTLSLEVARRVKQVYAVDVSKELTKNVALPPNLKLIIANGFSIPVPQNSMTVAYSYDLMEHLHPDDAYHQLQDIYKALAPGSTYLCFSPNRLSGPHDVSMFFDDVAAGFHLKEYTITELRDLFRKVGFSKISIYIRVKGFYLKNPFFIVRISEKLLSALPFSWQRKVTRNIFLRAFLGIHIAGKK